MRLPTAKYYTPAHRTVHERGIKPNILATLTLEEEKRLLECWGESAGASADPRETVKLGDRHLEQAAMALRGVLVLKAPRQVKPRFSASAFGPHSFSKNN